MLAKLFPGDSGEACSKFFKFFLVFENEFGLLFSLYHTGPLRLFFSASLASVANPRVN